MTLAKPRTVENPGEAKAYMDRFIIPLLCKVGLRVKVKRDTDKYTITVKLT